MEKDLIRKGGNTRGVRTQKMVTFRCDIENIEWLDHQPNKGRYINEIIEKDRNEKSMM